MKGQLKLVLLTYLTKRSLSGYGLMKEVETQTGWKPSFGAIYPLLKEFKREGLVTVKEEKNQKTYSITVEGKKVLNHIKAHRDSALSALIEQMRIAESMHDEHSFGVIIRILEDLKQNKLPFGPLHKEVGELRDLMFSISSESIEEHTNEIRSILKGASAKLRKYAQSKRKPAGANS
jgi:DNA-binding PadR family transcriptional regulator